MLGSRARRILTTSAVAAVMSLSISNSKMRNSFQLIENPISQSLKTNKGQGIIFVRRQVPCDSGRFGSRQRCRQSLESCFSGPMMDDFTSHFYVGLAAFEPSS